MHVIVTGERPPGRVCPYNLPGLLWHVPLKRARTPDSAPHPPGVHARLDERMPASHACAVRVLALLHTPATYPRCASLPHFLATSPLHHSPWLSHASLAASQSSALLVLEDFPSPQQLDEAGSGSNGGGSLPPISAYEVAWVSIEAGVILDRWHQVRGAGAGRGRRWDGSSGDRRSTRSTTIGQGGASL
eukprot:6579366-Prymnesium_polylepis.1